MNYMYTEMQAQSQNFSHGGDRTSNLLTGPLLIDHAQLLRSKHATKTMYGTSQSNEAFVIQRIFSQRRRWQTNGFA